MSRTGKINWKKLWKAASDTFLIMVFGLFLITLVVIPIAIALFTDCIWWLLIYAVVFFVMETWEKYNER